MSGSFWPLPGGGGRYVVTLLEILNWVGGCEQPTSQALYDWMRKQYGHDSSRTPRHYAGVLAYLGYLDFGRRGDNVSLTERGRHLLETGDDRIVLDDLLRDVVGVYDVLNVARRLSAIDSQTVLKSLLDRYPKWQKTNSYQWRLDWLYSCKCLKKDREGYMITPRGEQVLLNYAGRQPPPPSSAIAIPTLTDRAHAPQSTIADAPDEDALPDEVADAELEPPSVVEVHEEAEQLAERISVAARESEDATGFEWALVDAFQFLGFEAEHKGGPGDTDVLVKAALGQETYRAVIDGKSSRSGKVVNINWPALARHKMQNGAQYILVVAPDFSGGDLLNDAEQQRVALLRADDLAAVVRLHASTPLSLADLRELFQHPGDPKLPLQQIKEIAREVKRLQELLPDIIQTFEDGYRKSRPGLSVDALDWSLARDYGDKYSRVEIVMALDLLCSPLVGALRKIPDTGYALQMPMKSVERRFQAQARQLLEAAHEGSNLSAALGVLES